MADVSTVFEEINTFSKENESLRYKEMNPTSRIPMITEGHCKIIGEGLTIYMYLMERYPQIKAQFFC